MGLVDEAIAEFQLAAREENRLLECSSMLGICFLEKGMPKLAAKWFEKGLGAPGHGEEEYQALRYDLATALEAAGEGERARQIFLDVRDENLVARVGWLVGATGQALASVQERLTAEEREEVLQALNGATSPGDKGPREFRRCLDSLEGALRWLKAFELGH